MAKLTWVGETESQGECDCNHAKINIFIYCCK